MKKILLGVMLAATVMSASAKECTLNTTPNNEDVDKFCTIISNYAEMVFKSKERGVPLEVVEDIAVKNEVKEKDLLVMLMDHEQNRVRKVTYMFLDKVGAENVSSSWYKNEEYKDCVVKYNRIF